MGGIGSSGRGRSITRVGDVIFGADRQIAGWVSSRIPDFETSPSARALGVIKSGRLVAGVVFERWNGVHIEAAIAAEPGSFWADRKTLRSLFYYPFVTLDCLAISVSVPSSNLPSLNLATKLGFEPEALIKFAAHDGSALVVLKMFRETCKWIEDHGQKGRQRTDASGRAGNRSS